MKAIRFFRQCLKKNGLRVSKLVLFGSQAHGTTTEDSDIDLIIVSDDFRDKDIVERAMMTKEAELLTIHKFLVPLDVLTMTPEEFEEEVPLGAGYARNRKVLRGT